MGARLVDTAEQAAGGRNILLLEDEAIVAMMLEDLLQDMGHRPLAPAMTVEAALKLIERGGIDAAILDINVGGSSSAPVAEKLRQLGIPFAFATGYTSPPVAGLVEAPLLQKPYTPEEIRTVLDGFFPR